MLKKVELRFDRVAVVNAFNCTVCDSSFTCTEYLDTPVGVIREREVHMTRCPACQCGEDSAPELLEAIRLLVRTLRWLCFSANREATEGSLKDAIDLFISEWSSKNPRLKEKAGIPDGSF